MSVLYKMNYSEKYFFFERNHDVIPNILWLQKYSTNFTVGLSVVYLLAIYFGQCIMKNFERREMKSILTLWNFFCALFATCGSLRMVPEIVDTLRYRGFRHSICNPDFVFIDPTSFWAEMFMWSKAVELIDTVFLVLRKRPVVFLHWYHHITVMMYTWHGSREPVASARWFISMNYTVHALMYTYYLLRTLGFNRLPKFIPMTLTGLQLSQMVMGCYVAASVYLLKSSGQYCFQSWQNLYFCILMYFSYGLLFARLFWDTYMVSKPRPQPKKTE